VAAATAVAAGSWVSAGPPGRLSLSTVYVAQPAAPPPPPQWAAPQPVLATACDPLPVAACHVPAISAFPDSKWHSSALSAGDLSEDGHVFAKTRAGPRKIHSNGMMMSSLCMIFERNLRVGGVHRYHYSILKGSVGAADGVGFVFDSRIRRTNIQRMRSVFLNKHGQVCVRNLDSITKLPCSLPKLSEGVSVFLTVDLDRAAACFKMDDPRGEHCGTANFSFAWLSPDRAGQPSLPVANTADPRPSLPAASQVRSGFFCAVVTGGITVALH